MRSGRKDLPSIIDRQRAQQGVLSQALGDRVLNPGDSGWVFECLPGQMKFGFNPTIEIVQDDALGLRQVDEQWCQLLQQLAAIRQALALGVVLQIVLDVDMDENIGD